MPPSPEHRMANDGRAALRWVRPLDCQAASDGIDCSFRGDTTDRRPTPVSKLKLGECRRC